MALLVAMGGVFIVQFANLEQEGRVCYEGQCEKKLAQVFRDSVLPYFDSIPIIEGTEHRAFHTDEIVGVLRKLSVGEDGWLHAGKVDWIPEHFTDPATKLLALSGKDIPGSLSDWVKIENATHVDQVPLHFLIHADLKPRIKGAGITKQNCYLRVNSMTDDNDKQKKLQAELDTLRIENSKLRGNSEELVKQLQVDNTALKAERDSYKTRVDAIEAAESTQLVDALKKSKAYTDEELKKLSLPELRSAVKVLGAVTPPGSGKSTAINFNRGNATADPPGSDRSFEELYKETKKQWRQA